jgi:hypothetical protein
MNAYLMYIKYTIISELYYRSRTVLIKNLKLPKETIEKRNQRTQKEITERDVGNGT